MGLSLYLRPEPPRHEVMLVRDRSQLEMWPIQGPHREKSPVRRKAVGAPLLLEPFRWEV